MNALWLPLALLLSHPVIEATGIIASTEPQRSVAILRSGGISRIVSVGDAAFGARVESIEPGRVRLRFDDETVEARLAGSIAVGAVAALPAPPPPRLAERDDPVVYEPIEMPRQVVDRRLDLEIPRILAQTRLSPVRENQQMIGFALERLPPGTLLTEIGLQQGDVLTEVNSIPLDSMATLVSLWPRLREAQELTATVLRGGRPVTLGVNLTP